MTIFSLPAITTSQMQELERLLEQDFHFSPLQLQETVGLALARLAAQMVNDDLQNRPIVVLAGSTSNGAISLVAARRLLNWGAAVQVICTQPFEELRNKALKRQLQILQSLGAPLAWAEEGWEIPPADLLIDGLGHYSVRRAAQGVTRSLIQLANSSAAPILSLHLPGGVAGEDGVCFTPHVRAAATLVIHLPMIGHVSEPARSACGQLYLAETGVPMALYEHFGRNAASAGGKLPFVPLLIEGGKVFITDADIMTKYTRAHDMDSWLSDPRIAARGFAHRWQSSVATGNGEDAFMALVDQYLRPEYAVLDLGCGHGELTLTLAARCRTIVGIEREAGYLGLAKELAAEQNITNAQFLQVNLAGVGDEDRVNAGIPLADDSIDLFVNRRGPLLRRYLDEAVRVARPGAVMVGLHPTGIPVPSWCDELPKPYQKVLRAFSFDEVRGWVLDPLHTAGISDYRLWWIDVPEFLRTPYELYIRLGGQEVADGLAYQDIESQFTQIFQQYSTTYGVVLRHQRLLWQAFLSA